MPAALRALEAAVKFEGLDEEWKRKQRRTRPCIQRKLNLQAAKKRSSQQLFQSQIQAILRRKEKCGPQASGRFPLAASRRAEPAPGAGASELWGLAGGAAQGEGVLRGDGEQEEDAERDTAGSSAEVA